MISCEDNAALFENGGSLTPLTPEILTGKWKPVKEAIVCPPESEDPYYLTPCQQEAIYTFLSDGTFMQLKSKKNNIDECEISYEYEVRSWKIIDNVLFMSSPTKPDDLIKIDARVINNTTIWFVQPTDEGEQRCDQTPFYYIEISKME